MRTFKSIFTRSLYIELLLAVVISFACGILGYYLMLNGIDLLSQSEWASNSYKEYAIPRYINSLQTFIYENEVSSEETRKLDDWFNDNYFTSFYIRKDDYIIYNSYILPDENDNDVRISADDKEFQKNITDYLEAFPTVEKQTIHLTDGDVTLYFFINIAFVLYYKLQNITIALAALLVIFILIIFVRRKIHYINRINDGIHVLEGGNLNYTIPVQGTDELAQVAYSLNSMRIALSQQMENEKKALQANNSLVTALSHDLRTPLTTQMGYLEILKEHHYSSPEEMDQYVNTALNTCQQIKAMSDRLFEYFLAFDPNPKRPDEALEEYEGASLFMQLFAELSLPLEAQGFQFEIEEPTTAFTIRVNMDDVLRIFNNVFTNIDKYADEAAPISVRFTRNDSDMILSITNKIRKEPRKNESAKIGLISISSLMKRQGGSSKTRTSRDLFTLELKFPTY